MTLENIKINSSVKIIVEKGAKLTLLDSVAYGLVEVNGGTLTVQRDNVRHSGFTSTITLNDGSTLKNSQIISNANYLTDGRADDTGITTDPVVIVNGNVTFEGENDITGDVGNGNDASQTGLQVNGTLTIPNGSKLTVNGGGSRTQINSFVGGTGIAMNDGTVTGKGELAVNGGTGIDGRGGKGVTGKGTISAGTVTIKGGDGVKVLSTADGADAAESGIVITTKNPVLQGGTGNGEGAHNGQGNESATLKPAPSPAVSAHDFRWDVKSGKLSAKKALKLSGAVLKNAEGKVNVDADQLAAINLAIASGKTGTSTLTFSATIDGETVQKEVTVSPYRSYVPSPTPSPSLAASDFSWDVADGTLSGDKAIELAKVSVLHASYTIKPDYKQLAKINETASQGQNGTFKLTFRASGLSRTVTVTLTGHLPFSDLAEGAWYADAVNKAADLGYMTGYAPGSFGPEDTLTRAQAAAVLFNMAGGAKVYPAYGEDASAPNAAFSDVPVGAWYTRAVSWAKAAGVVNGYGDGTTFGPEDPVTREQFASMLANYARATGAYLAPTGNPLAGMPDANTVSSWAIESVNWAITGKVMGNGGFIAGQSPIKRAEVAAMAVNYQPEGQRTDVLPLK